MACLPSDFQARPDEDDSRQKAAMLRLRELGERSLEVFRFQDQLLDWHRLGAQERRALWLEINAYVDGVRESQRVDLFMQNVCRRCPQGAGCATAILLGVPLAVLLGVLAANFGDVAVGWGLSFLWIAFMILCTIVVGHLSYRRYFVNRVIAPAEAAGFEPDMVVKTLEGLKQPRPKNPHIRALVKRLGLLKRLYARRKEVVPAE